jgi:hypothetical protein
MVSDIEFEDEEEDEKMEEEIFKKRSLELNLKIEKNYFLDEGDDNFFKKKKNKFNAVEDVRNEALAGGQ